jgi:N-acetyl-anhydromuramyl-L-alanine amidase AmpD
MVQIYDVGLQFKRAPQKRTTTDYIILHHAAASEASVTSIHNWHLQRGWAGIGYHYYVRKDGSIYRGRDEDTIGAYTDGYNSRSIGICAEGNFEVEAMPDAQKQAIIELLRELKQRYPNVQIKRHKDFANTACPGRNYPFNDIIEGVEKMVLKVGSRGEEVKKLQENLNRLGFNCGAADGIFGPKTEAAVKAFQKANGLAVDGIVGPATQAKLGEMLRKMEEQANVQALQARARQLEDELQQARNRVLILENELNKYKAIVDNVKKLVSEV